MAGNNMIFGMLFILFTSACAVPNYQSLNVNPQTLNALCFPNISQCTKIIWDIKPTETTMGSFLFYFFSLSAPGSYLDPAYTPETILWMPDMGHGSSPVTVERLSAGIYRASRVFFIMPGLWQIRIQMKDGNGHVVDQVIQDITI